MFRWLSRSWFRTGWWPLQVARKSRLAIKASPVKLGLSEAPGTREVGATQYRLLQVRSAQIRIG